MLLRVGHHGHERYLAAGAGGSWHGDERRQVGVQDLRALQRGEVHALAGERGGRALRGVDDRASADGHEPVAAALGVEARHLVHHVHGRVGRHLVEHLVGYAGGVQHVGELGGHVQLHRARVRHDQRVRHRRGPPVRRAACRAHALRRRSWWGSRIRKRSPGCSFLDKAQLRGAATAPRRYAARQPKNIFSSAVNR